MNRLSNREVDELGESYIKKYYELSPNDSLCVDIEGFATEYLGLRIIYETFAEKDADTLGYLADGADSVCVYQNGKATNVVYPKKTIVIDKYLLRDSESGRKRFTIAHEVAHFLMDKLSPQLVAYHHREYDTEKEYTYGQMRDILSMDENRADRLAAALIMPGFNMAKAMDRFADGKPFKVYGEHIMTADEKIRLQVMANGIGVSFTALQIRLKELGLFEYHTFDEFVQQDFQEGDLDDSDIEYDRNRGTLSPEKTYLVHRSRRDASREEQRIVKCPACGFRMATITVNTQGMQQLKCRKCQFNEMLSFAYFRKTKKNGTQASAVNRHKKKR